MGKAINNIIYCFRERVKLVTNPKFYKQENIFLKKVLAKDSTP